MTLVITDASCLIALDRVGRLDLIPALVSNAVAPPAVIEEFGRKPDWLREMPVQDKTVLATLRAQLDSGEAEAIAVALEHPGSILLIDERQERRLAESLGLSVLGTLGLLVQAKQRGVLEAVRPLMDALIAADFRVSEALYKHVVHLAGEEQEK
jgi:hypothetical protein